MFEVMGAEELFIAVNPVTSPLPLAARPIEGLEFVHVYVAPDGVLVKFVVATVPFAHTVMLEGTVTTGIGFTVIV